MDSPVGSPNPANPASSGSESPPKDDLGLTSAPNLLTLIRVVFVPIVIGLLFLRQTKTDVAAGLLFGAASITDYFDGYLARMQKRETVFGKLMDPLADKFLVVSSLIMLQHLGRIHPVVVMLLICRELAITGLRALASAEGVVIPASSSAKWKTATQMVAIPFIMGRSGLWGLPLFPIGMVLLYISLGISLWSAKDYVVDFFRGLREARRKNATAKNTLHEAKLMARAARLAARAARAMRKYHSQNGS